MYNIYHIADGSTGLWARAGNVHAERVPDLASARRRMARELRQARSRDASILTLRRGHQWHVRFDPVAGFFASGGLVGIAPERPGTRIAATAKD